MKTAEQWQKELCGETSLESILAIQEDAAGTPTPKHVHETTVQNTRHGVVVDVPRWWAGRFVRVILLPTNNDLRVGG